MSGTESLDANYAKAGYHQKMTWGSRPALLLVDFSAAYFTEGSPLYGGEGCASALASAIRLLEIARATETPVIFTEVRYQKGGVDGGVFFRKAPPLSCFERGNPLGDFVAGISPRSDEPVITKQYPSAFFGTSLAAMLTAARIDTVLLTGVTTSGCVRATCVDAMSNGFITLVVKDACGDRAPGPHEANLYDMNAKYADVIGEETAADYLRKTSRN